jgi:hypothetical protein
MPKADNIPTTPRRTDHDLLVLGEIFTAANKALGADALDDIERATLTAR